MNTMKLKSAFPLWSFEFLKLNHPFPFIYEVKNVKFIHSAYACACAWWRFRVIKACRSDLIKFIFWRLNCSMQTNLHKLSHCLCPTWFFYRCFYFPSRAENPAVSLSMSPQLHLFCTCSTQEQIQIHYISKQQTVHFYTIHLWFSVHFLTIGH